MESHDDEFGVRLRQVALSLPPTLRRVAAFLDQRRADVLSMSAIELAREIGTSDASIVRAARALGYEGLPQLRKAIARSVAPGPVAAFRQTLEASSADAMKAAEHSIEVHRDQLSRLPGKELVTLDAISRMLHGSERIVLFGIGPTAHIVNYGAHLLRRHGRRVMVVDRTGSGIADQLVGLERSDRVLIFAYGEPYPEVEALLHESARLLLQTALVTDFQSARMSRLVDHVALVPRGEARGMSLHALTLVWLEALVVSLSVMGSGSTAAQLERLQSLRSKVKPYG